MNIYIYIYIYIYTYSSPSQRGVFQNKLFTIHNGTLSHIHVQKSHIQINNNRLPTPRCYVSEQPTRPTGELPLPKTPKAANLQDATQASNQQKGENIIHNEKHDKYSNANKYHPESYNKVIHSFNHNQYISNVTHE